MPPPFVAQVRIQDQVSSPVMTPRQMNERVPEIVFPQKAPDPIRYGDTPSRKSRQQIYSVLCKRQIRAVMYDAQSGVLGKTEFNQFTKSPRGKALTWDERSNIQRGYPIASGSNFSLVPQTEDEAVLRSLLGV